MLQEYYILITEGSCEFCQSAVELLKGKKLNFINTDMENAPEILAVTKIANNYETVPMIWKVGTTEEGSQPVNNIFVGGYDELVKHLEES
tara:strand:- start:26 stop:295 length:270 start_codon:yes stop_codon:yes gene_type:complete